MAKVLLTGASGLIGSHIAELFAGENIPLNCLVRASSDLTFLKQLQIVTTLGDITKISSIQAALKDVDFVIHSAGKSADWGRYKDFYDSNVLGTMNVLKACKASGIHNLIITGSVSSYGEEDCPLVKNEDSPYNSHYPYFLDRIFPSPMNYYRDSKAILTQKAAKFATDNQLNLTIIEPAWVYGEREIHTGFYEYLQAVQAGMSYAPGSKTNKFHVIYARDLAEGYLLAYQRNLPGVRRLIIGNPTAHKMNEIYSMFCRAADLKPPKLLPKGLVYPLGFGMEAMATVFSCSKPPLLTRSRVNMMYDNIEFSVAKARELLGFKAKTSLQDGIRRTVDWYRQNGLLNKDSQGQKR